MEHKVATMGRRLNPVEVRLITSANRDFQDQDWPLRNTDPAVWAELTELTELSELRELSEASESTLCAGRVSEVGSGASSGSTLRSSLFSGMVAIWRTLRRG